MGAFDGLNSAARSASAGERQIDRICRLPIVPIPSKAEADAISRMEVVAKYHDQGIKLHRQQVGAILAWDFYQGLFAPIGVGDGKTLITLMIAQRALVRDGYKKAMILVPSSVYSQLIATDIGQARGWVGLSIPFIYMGGGKALKSRRGLAGSGKPGCYILPYSLLRTTDGDALLSGDRWRLTHPDHLNKDGEYDAALDPGKHHIIDGIRPDVIIADEAHRLTNIKAAQTKRVRRYLASRDPDHRGYDPQGEEAPVRFCALSGTITSKSVMDFHAQLTAALGTNSCLPIPAVMAGDWGAVLDVERSGGPPGIKSGRKHTGPLAPLVRWAQEHFPKVKIPEGIAGFRAAFRLRLESCPGVVVSGGQDLGTTLVLANEPVPKPEQSAGWAELNQLMFDVEEEARSPSGDEISHGFQKWKFLFELTAGFYNRLRWPSVKELVEQGWTADDAAESLARAQAKHEHDNQTSKCMRSFLERHAQPSLDSPLLVYSYMAESISSTRPEGPVLRFKRGRELYESWCEGKELEEEGLPQRISEPIRVCPYKVDAAVAWAKRIQKGKKGERGGIVWYYHDGLGEWLYEAMADAGIDVLYCPSESTKKGSDARIRSKANVDKIVVAAWAGHGEGKNLQFHVNQRFVQFPRQAKTLQQILGRLHRTGQTADEITASLCNTTEFDNETMFACLVETLYIHQTTGTKMKAALATYNPLPKTYPPDFLRERGFVDLPKLDSATIARLEERFGPLKA